MKTIFETALDKHEISEFFKGEGVYFARGSDWGDHLYISNWQDMCSALKNQKHAQSLLTNIFEEYVRYLKENYEDASSLLLNISAYYIARSMFPFLSAENYDLLKAIDDEYKKKIGCLFRLLRNEYDVKNKGSGKNSLDAEIEKINKNGCVIELEKL